MERGHVALEHRLLFACVWILFTGVSFNREIQVSRDDTKTPRVLDQHGSMVLRVCNSMVRASWASEP